MREFRQSVLMTALSAVAFLASADNVNGGWDSPEADNWPMNALHVALMPDGRVLSYGAGFNGATAYFIYDVWDPAAGLGGGHLTLPNTTQTDIFCSNAAIIPGTGDIIIAGGDTGDGTFTSQLGINRSTIFRSSDLSLERGPDMNLGRWYAAITPLMNGEIYVQGGKGGEAFPEVRRQDGTFRLLDGAATGEINWNYPRTFLAPDGGIFGFDNTGQMFSVNLTGSGSLTKKGSFDISFARNSSTVAMFAPYKLLQVSGLSAKALVIDFSGATPVLTEAASLSSRRSWANSTVLPNGRVLVTGGSQEPNTLIGVNNHAEIWDPQTNQWMLGPEGSRPRLYHSTALLLPDASVLVAGGGSGDAPLINLHAEIYYPPYLYDEAGGFAARPTIESELDVLAAGESFQFSVGAADAISRVTLIRTGVATHSINNTQNFNELGFTLDGGVVTAQMPADPIAAPPGYYLLFVVNDVGVPSRAKIVRINPLAAPPDPPDPPDDTTSPSTPGSLTLSKASNGWAKLDWGASSDNVGVAGYSIHRTTSNSIGLEIKRVSGALTWTDTTAQEGATFWYAVRAYDAAGNVSGASPVKNIVPFKKPSKPANFAVKITSKKPQLNFTRSTDNVAVVGYNVYRSTNGSMGSLYTQIGGPAWIDSSAQKGKKYTYAVRARDAAGYLSNATSLKTITSQ